ncbi:MAG: hypothetical protein ACI83W_001394 [Marinoscillum sp.]|jgi:hypothetical protein
MKHLFIFLAFPIAVFGTDMDTVNVSRNQILILKDTIYAPDVDTVFYVPSDNYKIRGNPYKSSKDFYEKMKEKTGQNKVTAQLFDLLYVNSGNKSESQPKKTRTSNEPFIPYEGRRITAIRIMHVDILEGSVRDTLRQASSEVAKIANRLHVSTWNQVIKNNLLIDINDEIDPFALADNERVLRSLRFIEDTKIYVNPIENNNAELIIVVKDRLSWGTAINVDDYNKFRSEIFNRNIAGWGKSASFTWLYDNSSQPRSGYELRTGGQNIHNTITSWDVNYSTNKETKSWGIYLQKDFVAPEIKYGGGIDLRKRQDSLISIDRTTSLTNNYNLDYQDIWVGRSFRLPSDNARKNVIIAGRYLNHSFKKQPYVSLDSNFLFYDRKILLAEASLSNRKFLKSNYVNSFGISEDIPLGYRLSYLFGVDYNQFYSQKYFGFQFYWSFFVSNFGYLLINQEIGGYDRERIENGVYRSRLDYFTPLISINRYHIRNFVKLSFVEGINQPNYRSISLRSTVRDIDGPQIIGNSAITFSVESVTYTPWYFYGFRFAPFAYYNAGEVWDVRKDAETHYRYQGMGLGVRIKNESLVLNTLELRFTKFIQAPLGSAKTIFSLSTTIPLSFGNIFTYKPTFTAFE